MAYLFRSCHSGSYQLRVWSPQPQRIDPSSLKNYILRARRVEFFTLADSKHFF